MTEVRETIVQYHARYSDNISYQVVYDPVDKQTHLATEDGGRMPVPYYIDGATFVEFYFTASTAGISTAYAWTLRSQMDQLLTRPVKAAPPAPPVVEEGRLHIEPKLGTESSLQQLQRANWERTKQDRANREAARAAAQDFQPDPQKVVQARDINNQHAARLNRHGIQKEE